MKEWKQRAKMRRRSVVPRTRRGFSITHATSEDIVMKTWRRFDTSKYGFSDFEKELRSMGRVSP